MELNKQFSKFQNFLASFGASRLLLQRAHDEGFLIEGMILYASLIDGLLRIAIILKNQIDNKNSKIDEKLISQEEGGDYFTERKIIELAHRKVIINRQVFSTINSLYNERNKIVHRFFLSGIEYSNLPPHLIGYELLYHEIWKIVYDLESEQIDKRIGMTRIGDKIIIEDKNRIISEILKKINSKV